MTPEQKFSLQSPDPALLDELEVRVNEIEDLCHQKAPHEAQLRALNARLTVPVTAEEICSYAGACSCEEFLSSHLIPDARQHTGLSDSELLWLISKILEEIGNGPLLDYYSQIVELNTSAPGGRVVELVFEEGEEDAERILAELKRAKERVIRL